MPHWDEGLLQAWIDMPRSGLSDEERESIAKHVARCDACAARVAELRASSDRTAALLGSAERDEMPPFAAVLERAGGEDATEAPGSSPVRRRWSTTRWAASIVVALGAGWLANDLFRRGAMPTGPAPEASAVRALDLEESAAEPDIEMPAPPEAEMAARSPGFEAVAPAAAPVADAVLPTDPGALAPTRLDSRTRQVAEAVVPSRPTRGVEREQDEVVLRMLRGRVVDAATRRPLESVQVFVPELQAGALSNADGSFTVDLRGQPLDSLTGDVTVEAQLIGYGDLSRRFDLAARDTAALQFELRPTAVRVDELVVTGTRRRLADRDIATTADASAPAADVGIAAEAAAPTSADVAPVTIDFSNADTWSEVARDADAAGDTPAPHALPGLAVVSVRRATVMGIEVTRVEQRLDDGTPVTLWTAERPLAIQNRPAGVNVSLRQVDESWVAAVAKLDEAVLHDWLERVR
ncbi:MAG: carboxypeptidase-like regulatory domain-containing protein [Gemmatimonadetes bacterium]|nr:carboxypeptidase-like regulatory domain-containing protein [Gemmatimonadota bacterium]